MYSPPWDESLRKKIGAPLSPWHVSGLTRLPHTRLLPLETLTGKKLLPFIIERDQTGCGKKCPTHYVQRSVSPKNTGAVLMPSHGQKS